MNILTISGSPRADASNTRLLLHLAQLDSLHTYTHADMVRSLPLFTPELDAAPWPEIALTFRKQVAESDGVIISTPEYIHNIPAALKNCLEWLTSSGELMHKPILAITYTPAPPRGTKAMESLLWSLGALEARILASLPLYQSEVKVEKERITGNETSLEMLTEALTLFQG